MSPMGPLVTQTPEKSGLPFGKRGAGPSGTGLPRAAPPLPAGEVAAGGVGCANAAVTHTEAAPAISVASTPAANDVTS